MYIICDLRYNNYISEEKDNSATEDNAKKFESKSLAIQYLESNFKDHEDWSLILEYNEPEDYSKLLDIEL
ncbi:MAG: hypothetical protein ABSG25_01505 [Bryobacteraceae bacterium]